MPAGTQSNVYEVILRFPHFSYVMNLLGLASLGLRLRYINVRRLCRSGEYDAISKTCSRSERCKTTKVFAGTTSAIGTGRELDVDIWLRTITCRIIEDMSEYEGW